MTHNAQVVPVVFSFDDHKVRTIDREGEIWFVAQDVMDALDYSQSSNPSRVIAHIPDDWKGVNPIHTPGGVQEVVTLSEPGLYFFLGRSDKPKALPFQRWLAGEVLPTIRKTGKYESPTQEQMQQPGLDQDHVRRCMAFASLYGTAVVNMLFDRFLIHERDSMQHERFLVSFDARGIPHMKAIERDVVLVSAEDRAAASTKLNEACRHLGLTTSVALNQ